MPNVSATDYNAPFPSRLRDLMENTTQKELADKIGVSRQSISQYMDGSSQPVASKVSAIAEYFCVTTDYLLGRTYAKQPENINIVDKYGLSEAALQRLGEMHSHKRYEYLMRAVNALLENGKVLSAIAQYLYLNLPPHEIYQEARMISFRLQYKYGKKGETGIWGTDHKQLGIYDMLDAMTNDTYKRTVMLDIQEQLQEMLKEEDQKEPPIGG